jgi:hypothetical protein
MGVVGKNTNRPNIQQQSYHREFLARLCNGPWNGSRLYSSPIPHRKGQSQDKARKPFSHHETHGIHEIAENFIGLHTSLFGVGLMLGRHSIFRVFCVFRGFSFGFRVQTSQLQEKIASARITRTGNCSRLLQIVAFLLQKKEIIFTSCA